MVTMTLDLSEEAMAFIVPEAARLGFHDPAAYLVSLIEAERDRFEAEAILPLLREAIESGPATPMTAEDWASIRQEVRSRLAERVG